MGSDCKFLQCVRKMAKICYIFIEWYGYDVNAISIWRLSTICYDSATADTAAITHDGVTTLGIINLKYCYIRPRISSRVIQETARRELYIYL